MTDSHWYPGSAASDGSEYDPKGHRHLPAADANNAYQQPVAVPQPWSPNAVAPAAGINWNSPNGYGTQQNWSPAQGQPAQAWGGEPTWGAPSNPAPSYDAPTWTAPAQQYGNQYQRQYAGGFGSGATYATPRSGHRALKITLLVIGSIIALVALLILASVFLGTEKPKAITYTPHVQAEEPNSSSNSGGTSGSVTPAPPAAPATTAAPAPAVKAPVMFGLATPAGETIPGWKRINVKDCHCSALFPTDTEDLPVTTSSIAGLTSTIDDPRTMAGVASLDYSDKVTTSDLADAITAFAGTQNLTVHDAVTVTPKSNSSLMFRTATMSSATVDGKIEVFQANGRVVLIFAAVPKGGDVNGPFKQIASSYRADAVASTVKATA